MKLKRIEEQSTASALLLLAGMVAVGVFALADGIFGWDLLGEAAERLVLFLIGTAGVLLVSCVLVSMMLNLSIIASKLTLLVERQAGRLRDE